MIDLGMMPSAQAEAWATLVELYRRIGGGWTVVGGQMVYAHCMDRGYAKVRPTTDADAILDVRARSTILLDFTAALASLGFTPESNNMAGHQSHWERGTARVDVMIPTGLGKRASSRKGSKGGTALETPGAQKALDRSQPVNVMWAGSTGGLVPLPSLLGALVAKARAYEVDRKAGRERHLEDFVALASIARPKDKLSDGDKRELTTLSSGIGNARNLVKSRGDDGALDALDALVMMAGLAETRHADGEPCA